MASTISLSTFSLRRTTTTTTSCTISPASPKPTSPPPQHQLAFAPSRRQLLFLSSTATTIATLSAFTSLSANAQDIPLFGIRKRFEKVEEEAKEIINEGIETAEKGLESAEKGIEMAGEEIETTVSFSGFAQAGVVVGAEVVAVLVASSVVNGILEPQK